MKRPLIVQQRRERRRMYKEKGNPIEIGFESALCAPETASYVDPVDGCCCCTCGVLLS
jgi:hypothetical protein